jgi:hypothetical protein
MLQCDVRPETIELDTVEMIHPGLTHSEPIPTGVVHITASGDAIGTITFTVARSQVMDALSDAKFRVTIEQIG